MPRTRLCLVIVSTLTALLVATSISAESRPGNKPRISLQQIKELRQIDIVEPDKDGFFHDEPGLELTYRVSLPDGRQLIELHQPELVKATDSEGRDLSAIKPGFMDKLEYVKLIQVYGETPEKFTFHLALPARGAESFDLHAEFEAVTFAGAEEIVVEVTKEWTDLDAAMFGKKKVQIRLEKKGKDVQLAVRPGTVKAAIEEIKLFNGGTELDESFAMWNDMQINYSFNGEMADSLTAKLTVRTGLTKEMLTLVLDDQPLP